MVILQAKSVMERCKRQTLWNGRTTITQRVARFSARRCILQLKKLTDGKSGTIFRPHPNLKSTKQSIHDDFLMPRTSLNPASRKGMQCGAHRPLMKGWKRLVQRWDPSNVAIPGLSPVVIQPCQYVARVSCGQHLHQYREVTTSTYHAS